jgi:histone deacetylase 1/2
MAASVSRGTWSPVQPPRYAVVVGCKWVFIVKHRPGGSVERYTARLVAKGYT